MPEPASYQGSPSLSAEAREKVLQTFRHTLEMARTGRNEDALLGCDFILKMDARFTPARRLLASLRGVAAGTVVDLAEFEGYGPAPVPAAPAPAPAAPRTPASGYSVPPVAAPAPDAFAAASGLDGLGFGDLGANPFAAPAASAPPPAADAFAPSTGFAFGTGAGEGPGVPSPAGFPPPPAEPSFAPAPPSGAHPAAPPDLFASADPFASAAPQAEAFAPAAPPADAFAPGAAAPAAPVLPFPAPAASVDPRITQFLKQGDEASARGQLQEAIDLWSRVFLIDLSNEEASRRIDAARERQNDAARQLDVLLSEGVQLYEAGDLASARAAFLKVLTISESDATARNYLNRIDATFSTSAAPAAPPTAAAPAAAARVPAPRGAAPEEPYLRDELESPVRPSFAEDLPGLDERPLGAGEAEPARGRSASGEHPKGGALDARVLLGVGALVLVAVAAVAWFVFKPKAPAPPPPTAEAPVSAPAGNPLEKAQLLFKQGKVEEALGILTAIPAGDPRHDQALVLIDQFKSSAEPRPSSESAVSAAQLDEARLAGLASLSSGHYIDAVKSLDLVVKARPDDTEAAQALSRARDAVAALGAAIRSYNEQDYESAERLLWDLRKQDAKNHDVEEYLFKSYFNDGILSLQSGSTKKAAEAFKEAAALRPQDAETQRHLKFAKRYTSGPNDLLSRIYVKHVSPRP